MEMLSNLISGAFMEYLSLKKLYYKDNSKYLKEYESRFNSRYTNILDVKINEESSFYVLCPEILEKIRNIERKNQEIKDIKSDIPKICINYVRIKNTVDEIVSTNKIEGIHSSKKDIENILVNGHKTRSFEDIVKCYELIDRLDISLNSCEDIRNLYDLLLVEDIKKDNANNIPDGKYFRKGYVEIIKATGKSIHKGIYPETEIIKEMTKILSILHNKDINPLIQISLFSYYFGYIHPFYDGNGRIARFIASYRLANELDVIISLGLSKAIYENISLYYKAFEEANDKKNKGELTLFILMFLDMIEKSCDNAIDYILKNKATYSIYLKSLKDSFPNLTVKQDELCKLLLQGSIYSDMGITQEDIKKYLGINSPQTIKKRLNELSKLNLVKESKIRLGNRKYYLLNFDVLGKQED